MRNPAYYALAALAALTLAACAGSQNTAPATRAAAAASPLPVTVIRTGPAASQGMLSMQAASATPTPAVTPTPSAPPRPDVVVWWPAALMPGEEDPAAAELNAQTENFRETRARSLLIRTKRVDGPGGIMSTLHTAREVAPGALPDLALLPPESMAIAAETGLIYPLDDLLPTTLSRTLYPEATALGQVNGIQYGVPYLLRVQHTVYRETAFETPPTTYEAVLDSGQPFVFAVGPENNLNDMLLIQYTAAGGRTAGDDGRPLLDEEALLTVLTFYEEAVSSGVIDAAVLEYDSPADYWDGFLSGMLSFVQVDSSTYLPALGQVPNTAAAPVPTTDGQPLTTLSGWMWVLTTTDPDRQTRALEFLDWMMRAANQSALAQAMGMLPSQQTALQLWDTGDYGALIDDLLTGDDLLMREAVNPTVAAALQNALIAVLNGSSAGDAAAEALAALEQQG